MSASLPPRLLLDAERPSRTAGVIVCVASVAAATGLIYPLKHLAPVASLGVVYLPAVLIVSMVWGLWLGLTTALLSAAAFNYFHLPPVGQLTLSDSSNWVALAAFIAVAIGTGVVSELARARAREADQRRREADLAAELARQLLGAGRLEDALPVAAQRLAAALGVGSAAIELREVPPSERQLALALHRDGACIGTLLLPVSLSAGERARVRARVVPALEALVGAALERERLLGGVVETAALRRADSVKTALLRAVSHDLRSPLTAISAASEAIASQSLSEPDRSEMAAVIELEARRLSRLVDNLLDLSRLQAGAAEPRREWTSVEELIRDALGELGAAPEQFTLAIDRELPLVRVDAVQMERAFANVLDNARRHSGDHPVSVRARAVRSFGAARPRRGAAGREDGSPRARKGSAGERLIVRVVDRGPGIDAGELERVFEPFYRAGAGGGRRDGSGLGLAIARGFTEANAGFLYAESLPGQGATFVFELPLSEAVDEQLEGPAQAPADPGEVADAPAGSRADTLAAGSSPAGTSREAAGG